ncbi:MAG: hypothetical protein V1921_00035 [Candidatus Altiarchaeota archaeon]
MDNRTKIFISLFIVYAFFTHLYITTNDVSRFSLTASIVDKHTFEIGSLPNKIIYPPYNPIDFAVYNGRIYSDKAPLGSFLAVPFYAFARIVTPNYSLLYYICTLFVSGLLTALTSVIIYDMGAYFTENRLLRLLVPVGYGLGTIAFYYGTIFFSHSITTFFGFAAFYILFRIKREDLSLGSIPLAGLFAGLAVLSDYSAAMLLGLLSLYCIISFKKRSGMFFIPVIAVIGALFFYHYLIFGSPFTTPYKHLGNPAFAEKISEGVYGIGLPQLEAAVSLIFEPYRGLFFYNPLLILCILYLPKLYKRYKAEAILVVLTFLSYFVFNISYLGDWSGGACWGPRFLLPMLPFLFLSLYEIKSFKVLYVFLGISVIVNFVIVNLPIPLTSSRNPLVEYGLPYLKQFGSINFLSYLLFYTVDNGQVSIDPMPVLSFALLIPLAFILGLIWSERLRGSMKVLIRPRYFVLLLILVYIPIAYYGIRDIDYQSDEYIYFQIARAITEGSMPYRDVHATHMPLMLYVPAVFFRVLGPSILVGHLVPLMFSFLMLVFMCLIGEEFKKGAGALSVVLMLMASPLFNLYNHHYVGVMLALAPALASYYFHLKKRPMLSGFLIAVSIFVRLNNLILFAVLLFLNRKNTGFYKGLLLASPLLLFLLVQNFFKSAILFQMTGYHYLIRAQVDTLKYFLGQHMLVVSFFLVGCLMVYWNSERNVRTLLLIWSKGKDESVTLAAYPILYAAFMVSLIDWTFIYYFMFIAPFLSILASITLLSLIERRNDVLTVGCVMLLAFGLPSSLHKIAIVYRPSDNWSASTENMIKYITNEVSEDDRILFLSPLGPEISWFSGRRIVNNLFFFTVPYDRFDEKFLSALLENPPLVLIDLKYQKFFESQGLKLIKSMAFLKDNYRPVFMSDEPDKESVSVIWERRDLLPESFEIPEPQVKGRMYYFGQALSFSESGPVLEAGVFNESHTSEVFIPENFRGNNSYGIPLVAGDLLQWPIRPWEVRSVGEGGIVSEVWYGPVNGERIELFVFSYQGDNLNSFSHIVLNYETSVAEQLNIYSGFPEVYSNVFTSTYQQFPLDVGRYGLLHGLIQRKNRGDLSAEEFHKLVPKILGQSAVSAYPAEDVGAYSSTLGF